MTNQSNQQSIQANHVRDAGPHVEIGYKLSALIKEITSGMPDGPVHALELIQELNDLNCEAWSQRHEVERREREFIFNLLRRLEKQHDLLVKT